MTVTSVCVCMYVCVYVCVFTLIITDRDKVIRNNRSNARSRHACDH